MAVLEQRVLSSGTHADFDFHRSEGGIVGGNVHWGIRRENYELKKRTAELFNLPEKEIQDTGFDRIYQQDADMEPAQAIDDELEAVTMTAIEVMQRRGLEPSDIGGIIAGSGVPPLDHPTRKIPNLARELAHSLGLPENVITRNVYAACNSGARGFFLAHEIPELQRRQVLIVGHEPVTRLSHNPKRADRFSFGVFSNASAVVSTIPGVETEIFNHEHDVFPDKNRVLAARMTYKRLTEPVADMLDKKQIWQTLGDTEMMVMPEPSEGMDIEMKGMGTGLFFLRNVVPFVIDWYKTYAAEHPKEDLSYIFAHHPSWPVHVLIGNALKKEGIEIEIPWVVTDGNSSAATSLIAFIRLLNRAKPGTKAVGLSYGAGGSKDIAGVTFLEFDAKQAA